MKQFSSLFSQFLKVISRTDFEQAVAATKSEKAAKGFSCWSQFVAMLFCQLGRAHSLREIHGGMASAAGKLNHLGISSAPSRSTLSYANSHRPPELFEIVFHQILARCQQHCNPHPFRFKNKLYSLDSTTIELCLEMYDWAQFRRTKGAVKLHLLLDHDGCLPSFAVITDGKTHDINVAKTLRFPKGSIVAMDRGYIDYAFFDELDADGVWFVTRLKEGAAYEVLETFPVPEGGVVLSDELIRLPGSGAKRREDRILRRVVVWDEERQVEMVFLTNNMKLAARTVANIYKQRWQIELFFKALKQNFKIKTFVGTSANAVRIQIWTALIAILLLKFLQMRSRIAWSLSNLIALLRMNLFVHRDLWEWLDTPLTPPPDPPPEYFQQNLSFT